ncbi:hypothetical protein AB1Y20_005328 [Prymnesium parvum]|uniref:RING-type domain-containing protein n=1 Tax=Prymnesium parvum TaxID=97485 RepID=A0AB34J678_PRYPA
MAEVETVRCVICLEDVRNDATSRCPHHEAHRLCDGCFIEYVDTLPDWQLLSGTQGVPCPLHRSHHCGHFDTATLAAVYVRAREARCLSRLLERALPQAARRGEGEEGERRLAELEQQLHVAISLRCPSCDHVVDPSPDGCRAIECPHCGSYFCWVCFSLEMTNGRLHAHIVSAHGDLYLPQRLVDAAHREWRRRVVRRFMLERVELNLRQALLDRVMPVLTAAELNDPELPRVAALDPSVRLAADEAAVRAARAEDEAWLGALAGGVSVALVVLLGLGVASLGEATGRGWAGRLPEYMRERLRQASQRIHLLTSELQLARLERVNAEHAAQHNQRLLVCTSATAVIFGVAHLLLRARR